MQVIWILSPFSDVSECVSVVYDEYVWVWACFVVCVRMPCMYNVCIVCKSCIMYDGGGGKKPPPGFRADARNKRTWKTRNIPHPRTRVCNYKCRKKV